MAFEQKQGRREGAKCAGVWGKAYVACYNLKRDIDRDTSNPYGRKRKARQWKQEHTHNTALQEQPLPGAGGRARRQVSWLESQWKSHYHELECQRLTSCSKKLVHHFFHLQNSVINLFSVLIKSN